MVRKIAEMKVEESKETVGLIPKGTDKDVSKDKPKLVIGKITKTVNALEKDGERFIGYGEEPLKHPFKRVLTVESGKGIFTEFRDEATATVSIPLDVVNYVALRSNIDDIGREIKEKLKAQNIIKAVEWDEGLKSFVAELKVAKCLNPDNKKTVTDFNAFTKESLVNHEILTPELKQILHPEYQNICYRGPKLVLILSVEAVVSFVLAKGVITPPSQAQIDAGAKTVKLEKHVVMSNVEYKNDTLFYLFGFKEMPKEYTLLVPRANFVAINITMDERRAADILYSKVLEKIDANSKLTFVPGASIYKEADEYDVNLKREYINGKAETPMDLIPMIKLDATYKSKEYKYKNAIMNALVPSADTVIQLDKAKIKSIYNKLIPQGAVMTYLVNEEPVLLVDIRVMFAMAITNDITDMRASIKSTEDKFGYILHI